MAIQTISCYHCGSADIIRFGFQNGRQRFKCHACGKTSRQNKGSNAYDETRKAEILAAYHERGSLRAMTRIFGVSASTVLIWLKKSREPECRLLWRRIPLEYKKCLLSTDFWRAYAKVLPEEQHRATSKGEGQTCHVKRFNNILRQRLGRFVRKTLSFSKTDAMHENCLLLFLHDYNTRYYNTRCLTT